MILRSCSKEPRAGPLILFLEVLNRVAHHLAKMALSCDDDKYRLEECPNTVIHLVFDDMSVCNTNIDIE